MRYRDFVVQIGPPAGEAFPVRVLESPAGAGSGELRLPEMEPAGWSGEGDRDLAGPGTGRSLLAPEEVGRRLFAALFTGEVRDRYYRSLGSIDQGEGLRIQLRCDPRQPGLLPVQALPWELLFQPDARCFLGLDRRTPIVRHLDVPAPVETVPLPERLRILAVLTAPPDAPPLDLEQERHRIEEVCASQPGLELSVLVQPDPQALRDELLHAASRREPYHVLHFAGHGAFDSERGEGALLFTTAEGEPRPLAGDDLALLVRGTGGLRLAVLNACHSGRMGTEPDQDAFAGVAAALLLGGLPAVLGMRRPIPDDAAIAFSATLYRRLALGEPVDAAVTEARLAIYRRGRPAAEWSTPVLFLRVPDGRLFASDNNGDAAALAGYLGRLREACAEAFATQLVRPDRLYVPQLAHCGEPAVEVEILGEMLGFWQGELPRVAVLGNYGMGKSYFAWKTVLDQAERTGGPRGRIPVLFPLRDFNYGAAEATEGLRRDLVDQILSHLQRLDFPASSRRELVRWIEDGRIGIVLDGLDELQIPRNVSWRSVLSPLDAIPGACFAVTTRTAFVGGTGELGGWRVFHLLEWGERQWRRFLELREDRLAAVGGVDAFLSLVASRPQLSQLTTRPLWCAMIAAVADRIAGLEDLDLPGLYQEFFDAAVRRRTLAHQVLSLPWRYCAMERFAEECVLERRKSLHERQLAALLTALFETVGEPRLREYLAQEAKTYAFLNCDPYRHYSFGHASFESYFLAARLARRLAGEATGRPSGPPEPVAGRDVLAACRLDEDQVTFAAGILQGERILRSLGVLEPEDDGHAQLYSALCDGLRERLADSGEPPLLRHNLFRLLLALSRGWRRPRLRGLCLDGVDLSGLDLSGCDFEDVGFEGANLSATRFADSRLARCVFHGAVIDGADFSGADLAEADLRGVDLPQVPPVLAGLRNADRARLDARERRIFALPAAEG